MSGSTGPINWTPMIIGFAAGFISRVIYLRTGQTRNPGYPSGYITQLALAVIAAMIGSSVLVSLLGKEFTAATFLTLAATQFFNVRTQERKTLEQEEDLILVPRGAGYIEGIAITYEARNFLAMLVALATSAVAEWNPYAGAVAGVVFVLFGEMYMSGPRVGELIDVEPAEVKFEKGSLLYAGPVMLIEVGLQDSRERYLKEGLAVVLKPRNPRGEAALWNIAQRQAIAHEAAAAVGVQKDVGYPEQGVVCRMAMPQGTGVAGLAIIPVEHNIDKLIQAIKNVPVLESGKWLKIRNTKNRKEHSHG
ncbi:MAG: YIEGIA domain-containing protein [Firmicutes bacterium]|nr:YIEGIA domain-containing protein [Bacillota bacterium]